MGSRRLAPKCHVSGEAPNPAIANGANDILGRIQGECVAAAVRSLPPAAITTAEHLEIDPDAGAAGRVRFFAEWKAARHLRHSYAFWSIYRAEPLDSVDSL